MESSDKDDNKARKAAAWQACTKRRQRFFFYSPNIGQILEA